MTVNSNFLITRLLLLLFLPVILGGCGRRGIKNPQEVSGEYLFRYRTGEVEVLILRENLTSRQEFYRDLEAYKKASDPTFSNDGTWSYAGHEVTVQPWLSFFDFEHHDGRPLAYQTFQSDRLYWVAPAHGADAGLWVDEEYNYGLLRVKNRNEVKPSFPK